MTTLVTYTCFACQHKTRTSVIYWYESTHKKDVLCYDAIAYKISLLKYHIKVQLTVVSILHFTLSYTCTQLIPEGFLELGFGTRFPILSLLHPFPSVDVSDRFRHFLTASYSWNNLIPVSAWYQSSWMGRCIKWYQQRTAVSLEKMTILFEALLMSTVWLAKYSQCKYILLSASSWSEMQNW